MDQYETPDPLLQPNQGAVLPLEIDVVTVNELLQGDTPPELLDVREPIERNHCRIGEELHIPTGQIQLKWEALPKNKHLLVYCHHGMRSLTVTRFLRERGFDQVQSIRGGIEAWSVNVDSGVPRY